MNKYYITILCFMVFLSACRKDEIIEETTTETIEEEFFMATVSGTVEDLTGMPVDNANIIVGNQSTLTDENGLFYLEDVSALNTGIYISANKDGYFHSGKSIYASAAGAYKTQIVLSAYENTTSFSSSEGIEYNFQEDVKVNIPANAISLNGTPYNGNVNVHTKWLDPTEEMTFLTMPGDLSAITSDSERATLRSFGMIGVDLLSDSGEKLQITEGQQANLEFPVPSDLQSEADQTIDLWHFDEVTGLWREEGQANLVGNKYIANVSHFSWWNCDVATSTTLLCINFTDRLGNPFYADNILLELTSLIFGTATAYINDQSQYCGLVPSNVNMTLNLYTLCGDLFHTETIGPYTGATAEETVAVNEQLIDIISVSGTVTDCDGNLVESGYVYGSTFDNGFDYIDDNGMYDITFVVCNDENQTEVIAVDIASFEQGSEIVQLVDGQSTYTQDIVACGSTEPLDPLFSWIENPSQLFSSSNVCDSRVTAAETLIISDIGVLGINGFEEGIFTGNFIGSTTGAPVDLDQATVTIAKFGEVGENISGTFTIDNIEGNFISIRIQ